MREVIYKCDKCGWTIDKVVRIEAWFVNKAGSLTDKAYIFNGEGSNELDLCEDCAKALNDLVYPSKPEEKTEETEETEEEEEEPFIPKDLTDKLREDLINGPKKRARPGSKKNYDMGKIKALRDAGWSLKKIAEEMGGCSPQTIANKIKEAGV